MVGSDRDTNPVPQRRAASRDRQQSLPRVHSPRPSLPERFGSYSLASYATIMEPVELALSLRAGLTAWRAADEHADRRALAKAMRDNWDRRIGGAKFGGVWSIAQARMNPCHPASLAARDIGRSSWTGSTVTVEHAIPIRQLFDAFMAAESAIEMQPVIDAYYVAVVTRAEDARLRAAGLQSTMPHGWRWGDDPLARWRSVGIEVA